MENKVSKAIFKDCANLIDNFVKGNKAEFSMFCYEYNKIKFQLIYAMQFSDTDMILTTRQIFFYCKRIFNKINITTVLEKVGAIYLMYSTYYKQPQKQFVKIQIDMKTYLSMRKFIDTFDEKQKLDQVRYIFYELLNANAFRFVISDIYYGLEHFFNKIKDYTDLTDSSINHSGNFLNPELSDLTDEKTGLFTAFKFLETEYNEKKKEINQKELIESKRIPMTDIIKEYKIKFDEISKLFNIKTDSNKSTDVDEYKKMSNQRIEIKKKATQTIPVINKSIIDKLNDITDSSMTESEMETKEKLENPISPKIKKNKFRKYINSEFLNEPLPIELLKELGDS